MARMKTILFAAVVGLAVLVAGCVSTVDNRTTAGVPFLKDKIQARYERPMEQVFQAAKDVIQFNGTLVRESTLENQTNAVNNIAKTVEGKIGQGTVWVRVEQVDPQVTAVTVQARTKGGGRDIDLAAEIDKQIALKLVR
jgi:outer membrane murein-binding lipoprotein Lpp